MLFDVSEEAQARLDSFSLEGEDLLLRRMTQHVASGFYVDVGAHHPLRFSNTYALYKQGWRGINIDANPGTKELFDTFRPDDINLDELVSDIEGESVSFDIYKDPALNSAVKERRQNLEQYLLHSVQRSTSRLDTLLKKYLPEARNVDLLSVDVEGMDLRVLRSNNWNIVRPSFVLAEASIDLRRPSENDVVGYMTSVGYRLRGYLYITAMFVPENAAQY